VIIGSRLLSSPDVCLSLLSCRDVCLGDVCVSLLSSRDVCLEDVCVSWRCVYVCLVESRRHTLTSLGCIYITRRLCLYKTILFRIGYVR